MSPVNSGLNRAATDPVRKDIRSRQPFKKHILSFHAGADVTLDLEHNKRRKGSLCTLLVPALRPTDQPVDGPEEREDKNGHSQSYYFGTPGPSADQDSAGNPKMLDPISKIDVRSPSGRLN